MSTQAPMEQPYPRPLSGAPVTELPSGLIPARAPLRGHTVELVPQDARLHAADLYAAGHDSEHFHGQSSYLDINPLMGVIEIGHIWFGPQLMRTRAATEALYLMIRHAMDDLGYRRMHWRCNSLNEKSRQAARRLGLRFEGVFYNHMIFKGKNRDTAWYSILDDEWPEVRAIFETWLDDANFNDEGVAQTSLLEMMSQRSTIQRGNQS